MYETYAVVGHPIPSRLWKQTHFAIFGAVQDHVRRRRTPSKGNRRTVTTSTNFAMPGG